MDYLLSVFTYVKNSGPNGTGVSRPSRLWGPGHSMDELGDKDPVEAPPQHLP